MDAALLIGCVGPDVGSVGVIECKNCSGQICTGLPIHLVQIDRSGAAL